MQNPMQEVRPSMSPLALLAVGILAASSSSIFIRFALVEVPSLVIASYRLAIASLLLLPLALARYASDFTRLQARQWLQMISAGIFLGVHFGTWISSLEFTSVTSSVVLVQTTPIFVMLLSPLLLREKPSTATLLGLLLAIFGSLAIAISDTCSLSIDRACLLELTNPSTNAVKGDLLALSGAIAGAIYIMLGRAIRTSMRLIPYITSIYAVAALTLLSTTIYARLPLTGYSPRMYLWFLLLALFPQLLAHSIYNWALRYLPATSVSLSLLGEPVAAAILAYLILGESLPVMRWVGAVIVLSGIAAALYKPKKALPGNTKIDKMQG